LGLIYDNVSSFQVEDRPLNGEFFSSYSANVALTLGHRSFHTDPKFQPID